MEAYKLTINKLFSCKQFVKIQDFILSGRFSDKIKKSLVKFEEFEASFVGDFEDTEWTQIKDISKTFPEQLFTVTVCYFTVDPEKVEYYDFFDGKEFVID